jgi:hypothetical protein
MQLASMTQAVAKLMRQRGRHVHARDPLAPKRTDRQRFVRGDQLSPAQTTEIELQNQAAATLPRGSNPDPFGCPFPTTPLQPDADGVRR